MKKNVLLLETVTEEAFSILQNEFNVLMAPDPSGGVPLASENPIHGIVTRGKGKVDQELINTCTDLEVIARCGVGLDNIDVNFASEKGVPVVNAPGSNADTVAEHALSLMLLLQRNLFQSIAAVKDKNWAFRTAYKGDEIRGKTLGILGLGNIGQKVAALATAFGMEIRYWDVVEKEVPYQYVELEDLFAQVDMITIHLPLVPSTQHLIGSKEFESMQKHTLLINTARGPIIDQEALVKALQNGQIGGFAADVLEVEPPDDANPLLELPNVLITPHSASLTATTYNEMCVVTVNNVVALLAGNSISPRVIFNRNALDK